MRLQYLSDRSGITTGVQIEIPIEEWLSFKAKYQEFDNEETSSDGATPQWQVDLGRKERQRVAVGHAQLMDWNATKTELGI